MEGVQNQQRKSKFYYRNHDFSSTMHKTKTTPTFFFNSEISRGIGGWVGGWMSGLQKLITVLGRFYTYKYKIYVLASIKST